MNLMLWLLAGGFAGWVGFRFIGANAGRGLPMSMAMGIGGAYLSGSVPAPMLGTTVPTLGAFNPVALILLASACVCLTLGDMTLRRFFV